MYSREFLQETSFSGVAIPWRKVCLYLASTVETLKIHKIVSSIQQTITLNVFKEISSKLLSMLLSNCIWSVCAWLTA